MDEFSTDSWSDAVVEELIDEVSSRKSPLDTKMDILKCFKAIFKLLSSPVLYREVSTKENIFEKFKRVMRENENPVEGRKDVGDSAKSHLNNFLPTTEDERRKYKEHRFISLKNPQKVSEIQQNEIYEIFRQFVFLNLHDISCRIYFAIDKEVKVFLEYKLNNVVEIKKKINGCVMGIDFNGTITDQTCLMSSKTSHYQFYKKCLKSFQIQMEEKHNNSTRDSFDWANFDSVRAENIDWTLKMVQMNPLYTYEKILNKRRAIFPKRRISFHVKDTPIYHIDDVYKLYTEKSWYNRGMKLKETTTKPYRIVRDKRGAHKLYIFHQVTKIVVDSLPNIVPVTKRNKITSEEGKRKTFKNTIEHGDLLSSGDSSINSKSDKTLDDSPNVIISSSVLPGFHSNFTPTDSVKLPIKEVPLDQLYIDPLLVELCYILNILNIPMSFSKDSFSFLKNPINVSKTPFVSPNIKGLFVKKENVLIVTKILDTLFHNGQISSFNSKCDYLVSQWKRIIRKTSIYLRILNKQIEK